MYNGLARTMSWESFLHLLRNNIIQNSAGNESAYFKAFVVRAVYESQIVAVKSFVELIPPIYENIPAFPVKCASLKSFKSQSISSS